ncbi:MAG TPA: Tex family protein [Methylibium sp.]|uniref:Tex family protein n=1 Tax=Methylibium sp. TaxID=2067992 RepID=UPI002DBB1079|nr:Tex family protein [Methylibium sp.]HEU4460650.1 Tex family protein [Methylibium sp.]
MDTNDRIARQIADELQVRTAQVRTAIELLDGGATVPFIARYRKEATDGLDDIQLRELEARLAYLRELTARREAVLASIDEQGKLTPELRAAIEAAPTKQEVEDLYAPYKPRRRTKGMVAREAGLEPLADTLFADPGLVPLDEAARFIAALPGGAAALAEAGYADVPAALDGVRDLLAERWAEDAALVQKLRAWLWDEGTLQSRRIATRSETDAEAVKFRDYFEHDEPIARVPSHRALAMFRGRALEVLDLKLVPPEAAGTQASTSSAPTPPSPTAVRTSAPSLAEGRIAQHLGWRHAQRAGDELIRKCIAWAWKVKLSLSLERELFAKLREQAEQVAIKVFADNLRDLLLAAPAGPRAVMGLDPGIRTGVKVAVVDATGKLLATHTVYPHEPRRDWDGALHALGHLAREHGVQLVAIGNGTASRETDKLAAELIARLAAAGQGGVQRVVVSESGASIYSASEFASKELPELDVSLRGAVSIARRLQDPLAELVKIEPKSIGVGQYQHDVNQAALARMLDAVVEDCVNAVGVDLNTASAPLLSRVSGLSGGVAQSIVRWRDAHGAFRHRGQLREVAGLGDKTFEQAAGFLRIRGGEQPLDASGVHPETYPLVEKIAAAAGRPVAALIGSTDVLRKLRPEALADDRYGAITVKDVLAELEKPGRDPRPDFKVARFNDGVDDIKDLRPGMRLQGTVSNVAAFGAFVDLGVHQDGLVHVSQLADRFVKDAREVVKTGDVVEVRVVEVDVQRARIALSMKAERPGGDAARGPSFERAPGRALPRQQPDGAGAMAAAFAKLRERR